jgi:hypothetical protein
MSTMRWTYKSNTQGVALVNGHNFKKGDVIPVTVYELYTNTKGGVSQTVDVYYLGYTPEGADSEPTMRPPSGQQLQIGNTFELAEETSAGVSPKTSKSGGTIKELSNNKTVMWLGIIVVSYFAYKYFNKK